MITEEQALRLQECVEDWVEDSYCRFDHHGYCQEHGWLDDGECVNSRARKLLAEINGEEE